MQYALKYSGTRILSTENQNYSTSRRRFRPVRGPAAMQVMMLAGAKAIAARTQPPSKDNVQQIFLSTMFIKENIFK